MLDLASPVWGKLHGPYGLSDRVPALIEHIQDDYFSEEKEELYWELLYHQNTIYPCTYAAVPYLVEIALKTENPGILLDIFITCGIFEASSENTTQMGVPSEFLRDHTPLLDQETIREIYRDYRCAIQSLTEQTESILHLARMEEHNADKHYILAADAAFRGDKDIANMLLTFSEGDEYVTVCPTCDQSIYLWPDEEEEILFAYEDDPVAHGTAKRFSIIAKKPDMTNDSGLQKLYQRALEIGDKKLLAHLPYLAGELNCCSCETPIHVWTGLFP
ncbi:hypothetical protein E8L90_09190 [Brevibacillus antibioticus]|uniref:Uncharacterized protein n=1 Tax=Brevibacillus antibioticus TaxID=2570228 RepID=A0A4V5TIL3_9BACL|nr:hypothetical protein [Brevibacillus antibioticus]TKI55603.1 hypothetical protein E8L90_09190 [Brevibacillus antibioticus]